MGATVSVVDGNVRAITDANGQFRLSLPKGKNALTISYLGYKTEEVIARNGMRVYLYNDSQMLNDVIIVGYGSGQKVGTVVGSVTTVNAEKLNTAPSSSALDALQGQVAGMSVLTSSGEAGDNAVSMNIHGIGSLDASSTPLYVIDGIPSSSRTIMAMNPNDIKSITVLKDASATSIYGSRAANGVVYVTTKGGSYNTDAKVTFRTEYGWSTLADKSLYEDMLSGDQLKQFWLDAGFVDQDYIDNLNAAGYDKNTKWYNVFQQFNNPQTQNDVTIEGGGEKVAYLISASQFHQRGTTVGNYYNRYTVRSNINARPLSWLRTGMSINLSYDKRQRNSNWGNSDSGNANYLAGGLSMILPPFYPQYKEDGEEYQRYPGHNQWNPEYYMSMRPDVYMRYGVVGNAFVEITPLKGLKIMSRLGSDTYFIRNNRITYPSYAGANGSGTKGKSLDFEYSNTITNTIEYKFDVEDDHHFTVLAGHEGVRSSYDYFYARSQKQTDDRLMNLQNGAQSTYAMSESATASKFLSFFGRLDYNYLERYFFDASIRNDGCSRFGVNNRNATFWSAGAMWKIKQEDFMKDYTWLDDLNLKVSYGTQGNAALGSDYPSLGLISTISDYNQAASWVYGQPGNPNLTWEKQKLFTIGVNGRVFDRLSFDIQYYVRTTTDMLMDVPYPYTSGFENMTTNVGSLKNRGIDIELGVDILKGKDYYLNFRTVFNYNAQKITELFQGRDRWEIANTGITYVVGSPVMFYYPIFAGVDPQTGAPTWYKAGENPDVTTKSETTDVFDKVALTQNTGKKRFPPVNGGFSISGGWKGLSLVADFTYVLGKYLINNDKFFYLNPSYFFGYNTHKDALDYWTPNHTNAAYPDWYNYTMEFDTNLLENASFMRLKNLQIGYDLPKKLLGFQKVVKGLKFTFTGRNLFTITKYGGIDPEVNSNLTLGKIGNSKQYLFGAEVTF